jgi:hypothetical protein
VDRHRERTAGQTDVSRQPCPDQRRLSGFLIDNARMTDAGYACDAACFANNQPDLQEGLDELEIKAEVIRYVVCATSDLLQDAAFDVEAWLFDKVSRGFGCFPRAQYD